MRTENATIDMHLVDDHEFQALEELRPFGVMRQDTLMQHVRIGDNYIPVHPYRFPCIPRRIAIKGKGPDSQHARLIKL